MIEELVLNLSKWIDERANCLYNKMIFVLGKREDLLEEMVEEKKKEQDVVLLVGLIFQFSEPPKLKVVLNLRPLLRPQRKGHFAFA
jgi:hypothetical protein